MGISLGIGQHADDREHLLHSPLLLAALQSVQAEAHVLFDFQVWEQGKILENHADIAPLRRQVETPGTHFDIIDKNTTAPGGFESGYAAQNSGLTTSTRSQHTADFTGLQRETDLV